MDSPNLRIAVLGGGVAGVMAAITAAETHPRADVTLLERGPAALTRLALSGDGLANFTCLAEDPAHLAALFPRGARELQGPFHHFGVRETLRWLSLRDLRWAAGPDGRVLAADGDGAGAARRLRAALESAGVRLQTNRCAVEVRRTPDGGFRVWFKEGEPQEADRLILATGGAGKGFGLAQSLGHTVIPPVPSLFNFHTRDPRLRQMPETEVEALVSLPGHPWSERGPVRILPQGLGGPAIVRLSSWAAREIAAHEGPYPVRVHWAPALGEGQPTRALRTEQAAHPRRAAGEEPPFGLPGRLWVRLLEAVGVDPDTPWSQLDGPRLGRLAGQIAAGEFAVEGKSMNKGEYVTCGGVSLPEVDFQTMASRVCPGLFLVGEILDLDGLPGGPNHQAAWTTGHLAGRAAGIFPWPARDPRLE